MDINLADLFSITGKTALVTGGSRGIGEMIAAGFLAAGAKVYISSRKAEVCDATAARLMQDSGGQCVSLPADLSTLAGCESLAEAFGEREAKLDILVNNAGTNWNADIEDVPESGWDKVMDTNVKGLFFLTQKLLPFLRASGTLEDPARVINIGSIVGVHAVPRDGFSYGAAKAAVHHLTRVLAIELTKQHINCNAIAPGPFPTSMLSSTVGFGSDPAKADWDAIGNYVPRGKVGTAEDIAGLSIFLSSRAGSNLVGQVIGSDGGMSFPRGG